MASSLRSRLWLSYALVILVALMVVAGGLVVTLQRNPILYRQTVQRLYLAGEYISYRINELPNQATEREDRLLQREGNARNIRLVILDQDGSVVMQYGPGSDAALPKLALPLVPTDQDSNLSRLFRDEKGVAWLYTLHSLDNRRFLMAATPLPTLKLREIFRDEIWGPFLQAALAALLLAVGLSLLVGQWIARPLKRMAESARKMDSGLSPIVSLEGPREVQQLGEALNEMSHKVQISQQSQRDFLANVSHELKTPLTSIQGFAQAILDGAAQTPQALQQAAGVIYTEASRMHRMVLDLLALARLEGGTADLRRNLVDLSALLKGVVDKFALQAQQAQVAMRLEPAPVLSVIGDGDRLSQVFTNLIDNALKFTPAGGTVAVRTTLSGDFALIKVVDTGIGISPDDQARVFERFYQVDKSRKGGSGRGVGLGLAIAAQIVAAHGGRIEVESQLGKGSTFTVSLPVIRPRELNADVGRGMF